MDDPGILVWDGVAGDWMFQSEKREWRVHWWEKSRNSKVKRTRS